MRESADGWTLDLPLTEVGYFKSKAYLLDPRGWQHWPSGADFGVSVHPDSYRTANTIYCAFTRLFGGLKNSARARLPERETALKTLDKDGYTVIPPSGKLRDLVPCLPHIIGRLGCRILHLLPVNSTPTTYARFGRFGSPYAALDLTAIDPALVVFDRRTTGVDQFQELARETHRLGGRLFLDIVINHTGWGSVLQENHPDWFLRQGDGAFLSPGAWGTTWEDLVELDHAHPALWDVMAEMFLTWCRRGVDGFRCDAGYKVARPVWQYIIARVQREFPETIFLLEGLGGAWEATEELLTEGGMQWAYSELFQNYSGREVASYLDHSNRQSQRVGVLVHYSETHDNERLAAKGRAWSLLRNRLCALASSNGGFGFTCGVEWLASERVNVHGDGGLAWDSGANLVPELSALNKLLSEHPCFFDQARLTRLSSVDSPVFALLRESEEGEDLVLALVNTGTEQAQTLSLEGNAVTALNTAWRAAEGTAGDGAVCDLKSWVDLLGQTAPDMTASGAGGWQLSLAPGAGLCLAPSIKPRGLSGDEYRNARGRAAWGMSALSRVLPAEEIGAMDWLALSQLVDASPSKYLSAILRLPETPGRMDLERSLRDLISTDRYPQVIKWSRLDARKITMVPPDHWLLLEEGTAFRASLAGPGGSENAHSIRAGGGHIACFPPRKDASEADLDIECYDGAAGSARGAIRFLSAEPRPILDAQKPARPDDLALLTNGRGGMARIRVDFGRVCSKYDCILAANLDLALPVDRHVFAKRIRLWVNADGFITPLDFHNLASFRAGPPAVWDFVGSAGDGRRVRIRVSAYMVRERNTTVLQFSRPAGVAAGGKELPEQADVRLTARVDIEDRNFHWETRRNGGADYHFSSNVREIPSDREGVAGFEFTPASDRRLRVFSDAGLYHSQPEWCENIPHPIEQSRGQTGSGDAYSPGWFELPLRKGVAVTLAVDAEPSAAASVGFASELELVSEPAGSDESGFEAKLDLAVRAFVVRRGAGKTVVAGYPWFLDWGRDTFISARGLLAAGMVEEVFQLVLTFARFEKDGTLPNTIFGENASNRDTSDAPLWFAVVCEELAGLKSDVYETPVAEGGRTVLQVLESIASNYLSGTPNGIRVDAASGLVWSPSHFTWMDTNYPACTPREGYPVEIQALWIRLLRQLGRVCAPAEAKRWLELAERASASFEALYWLEEKGYYADSLIASAGQPATGARQDDLLRSNNLFAISLGLANGTRARRCVEAALRYLVVPGALRSLAPLPASFPRPLHGADGRLLNNPAEPYWGAYEGDEDTRRKPAYHNGTAWTWTFPVFCEAFALAWNDRTSLATAIALLGSMDQLLGAGCIGQLPEIVDGDVPHTQRGCDAQAWGATEALRIWRWLKGKR
jgi:predicted glycogen debranching enzyme